MAGPWEKYAAQPLPLPAEASPAQAAGPWSKYTPQIEAALEQAATADLPTAASFAEDTMIAQQRPPEQGMGQRMLEQILLPADIGVSALSSIPGLAVYGGQAFAGLIDSIRRGTYGSSVGGQQMSQRAMEGLQQTIIQPRTQMGQQVMQAAADVAEELKLAPVPVTAGLQALAGPATAQAARAAVPAARAAQAAGAQAAEAVMRAPETISRAISRQEAPAMPGSAGAAATEAAARRVATAEMMPVPFVGESGLTLGQGTRSFSDLQFEKEAAKIPELGEPLRQRSRNQNLTLLQNFDALIDLPQPLSMTKPEIGAAVTEAVVNKANVARKKISDAYRKAEEEGELLEPVEMSPLASSLTELNESAMLVPLITAVRNNALKIGAVSEDPSGNLVPGNITLKQSEILRQFVNENTNWQDRREALFAKRMIQSIDDSTEGAGGELYKSARKMRRQFAEEFENTSLTQQLLGTKGKTTERKIAIENVFDKIVRFSSVEEMNKLRGTLLTAGPDGKQAWTDLKAQGIAFIRDAAMTRATDESGQRVFSAPAMQKAVESFDKSGKLEALYGKRQAQVFRDLADIAQDIYTAPPGAINTSSTASALMTAVDTLATFGISGLPVPAKAAITEAVKYARDRKVKQRIERALQGPRVEQK